MSFFERKVETLRCNDPYLSFVDKICHCILQVQEFKDSIYRLVREYFLSKVRKVRFSQFVLYVNSEIRRNEKRKKNIRVIWR